MADPIDNPISDPELDAYSLLQPVEGTYYTTDERTLRQAIARLVGEVQRIRVVMSEALDALEVDDPAVRRRAFEQIQEHFEGVYTSPDGWIEAAADEIAGDPSCIDDPDRVTTIIRGHKVRGA